MKHRKRCTKRYKRGRRTNRKGKINPWVKGAIAAVAPSILATGYGVVKHLLKTNKGYSNIYA